MNSFNDLKTKYGNQLLILGLPCNQFAGQSPGDGKQNLEIIKYVRPGDNFTTLIDYWFDTIDVNGEHTHEVFKYLKQTCPNNPLPTLQSGGGGAYTPQWLPIAPSDLNWNFEKFLVNKTGFVYKRYAPMTYPDMMESDIDLLLAQ